MRELGRRGRRRARGGGAGAAERRFELLASSAARAARRWRCAGRRGELRAAAWCAWAHACSAWGAWRGKAAASCFDNVQEGEVGEPAARHAWAEWRLGAHDREEREEGERRKEGKKEKEKGNGEKKKKKRERKREIRGGDRGRTRMRAGRA